MAGMRFPRRYRWVLAVAGAFGLLAALVLAYLSGGRYTRALYDRIQLDMTPAEIEAVLGPTALDFPTPPNLRPNDWLLAANEGDPSVNGPRDLWMDDRGAIYVICYTRAEERRV